MSNNDWTAHFRERLEVLRSRYDVSKAELARRSGLPPRTVENYFKGQKPSIDALLAIAEGMNVEVHWLLGQDREKVATDLLGEASWIILNRLLTELIERSKRGENVIEGDRILGWTAGKLAAEVEARVVKQYLTLLDSYAQSSIEAARELEEDEEQAEPYCF